MLRHPSQIGDLVRLGAQTRGATRTLTRVAHAGLPFFAALAHDIRARTETAMPQAHAFKVMELAIRAQEIAEADTC